MMASRTFIQNIQTWILLATILTILPQTFGRTVYTHLTDLEGTVMSPGYPNNYPDNYHQIWEIRVLPGLRIILEFNHFSTESQSECKYDYVRIFNGEYIDSSPVSTFCGARKPSTIISSTNVIHIELKTDHSNSYTGFFAKYRTTENPCENRRIPCDDGECIIQSSWCNEEYDCTDRSDEKYCQTRPSDVIDHTCTDKHFQCSDAMCIPVVARCDRYPDCWDRSDEENCDTLDQKEITNSTTTSKRPKTESSIRSIAGLSSTERNLTLHILGTSQRGIHTINKWGAFLPRMAITLFLNDQEFFAPGNRTGEKIAYELSLQLLSKLAMKKIISTKDLALYINALTVACVDPKDFFGVNLVHELRKRVNGDNYTHPFSVLTLCNANDNMTIDDVNNLQQLYKANFRPVWTDTQAIVAMALSCIHSRSDLNLNEKILEEMVSELKGKQHKNGTVDNLKTTALVVQALLVAEKYQTDFDLNAAIKFILQEVGQNYPNSKVIYYILPIFNYKSLAAVNSEHCITSTETNLQIATYARQDIDDIIQVQISLIISENKNFIRTWKVKVPLNSTFYDVLENIGTLEPAFRVVYSVSGGKPYVIGMGKIQDDIDDGLFWFIYTKQLSSTESPKLIEKSPADIQVKESEEFILWYRKGFWSNSEENVLR